MFNYNAICVISDLSTNKAGTITSGLDRFMEWKTKDGNYENNAYAQFDTFYEGMFQKARLLDILKNFILFSGGIYYLCRNETCRHTPYRLFVDWCSYNYACISVPEQEEITNACGLYCTDSLQFFRSSYPFLHTHHKCV